MVRVFANLERLLIGKSLKTNELKSEKFNVFWGFPVLSSDAISSVAYAGEEILWVLVPVLGLLSYGSMFYVALSIVFLMILVAFSYRQTIDAYPQGGGSYIVAKDNLGVIPGLIAGASLLIGYVLTVAVSMSAGTAAIVSAIPSLLPYKVPITLVFIFILTVGNLRGIRESAKAFGLPAYLFILVILVMIVVGIFKVKVMKYEPEPLYEIPTMVSDITLVLFLRAFSSGCTALTGIEAVSNGIPNFRSPSQTNAKRVLELMSLAMLVIFGGIAYLATLYHAVPNPDMTVVAQIAYQVFGGNALFYLVQVMTAIILIMASNTAFADLPLLLSIIARDGYAPRQFTKRGKRLGYSNGIIALGIISAILVILFKGDVHSLIPMYAVGVFISFMLSQAGMFMKWIRERSRGWFYKAAVNGLGTVITCVTAAIIGITKFTSGAWAVFVITPVLVYVMFSIKRHYNEVARQLSLSLDERPKEKIDFMKQKRYVIVPIDSVNKSFLKALNYARSISENIVIFHVSVDDAATDALLKKWREYNVGIPMVVKKSPYRSIRSPLLQFIESDEYGAGPKDTVTVVMPQLVINKWWANLLHNQTSLFIRTRLLTKRNIAIVTIPYLIFED